MRSAQAFDTVPARDVDRIVSDDVSHKVMHRWQKARAPTKLYAKRSLPTKLQEQYNAAIVKEVRLSLKGESQSCGQSPY